MLHHALVKLGTRITVTGTVARLTKERPNMAWTWRYYEADGSEPEGSDLPSESFTSRGDAESWLGENWRELAEGDVARVALWEGEKKVYEMSLEPVE